MYQPAKVRILEFYNDFVDKYLDRSDYELIQIDTDSMYLTLSASKFGKLVKSNQVKEYKSDGKAELLATTKYSERTPVFFKTEFVAERMIVLSNKCYYANKGSDSDYFAKNKKELTYNLSGKRGRRK